MGTVCGLTVTNHSYGVHSGWNRLPPGEWFMNVLVVEDDVEMAELLGGGLREEDPGVGLARDGRSALEISNSGAFDVILLDIMLPGLDGLSVAKELRLRREQVPV